jgi:hypothetical protein
MSPYRITRALSGRAVLALASLVLAFALTAGATSAHAATKHLTRAAVTRIAHHNTRAHTASVNDANLFDNAPTTTLRTFPWYEAGGSCTASGSALWNRSSNFVSLNGSAHSSAPFNACRAALHVRYYARDSGNDYLMADTVRAFPTACAVLDPTCPSTQPLNLVVANAVTGTIFGFPKTGLIDHITIAAELR